MTIPVSSIVDVTIAVAPNFPERAGFGTLCAVTAETGVIGVAERVRYYNDITGVAADWDANTELYQLAQTYFSQNPRPTEFKAAVRFPEDQPAQLRGGGYEDYDEYISIDDGCFTISIDGESFEITGLDFTITTDHEEIAEAIQTGLQAVGTGGFTSATCIVQDDERFVIDAGVPGENSVISFATAGVTGTDVHELLHLEQGEATKQGGINAETISASLNAIESVDQDWYGLIFTNEVRDKVVINTEDSVIAAAEWCQARTKMFFNTSNDIDALDSVANANTIGSQLDSNNLDRTHTTYSTYPKQYPACSAAARLFTTDFAATNSVITLKFKQLPAITTENLNPTEKASLDKYHLNAFIDVGGNPMYAEGWNATGRFTDEVHAINICRFL